MNNVGIFYIKLVILFFWIIIWAGHFTSHPTHQIQTDYQIKGAKENQQNQYFYYFVRNLCKFLNHLVLITMIILIVVKLKNWMNFLNDESIIKQTPNSAFCHKPIKSAEFWSNVDDNNKSITPAQKQFLYSCDT